jgi:glycosyltransferase involved in cell wall biosynthesis
MTVESPQVSVLMPAYNAAGTIGRAITSIVSQTFDDFELVVMDDGSIDGTARAAQIAAGTDRRVRIQRRAANLGLVATLQEGLELCRGPLIARLDADDAALPQRLARQVAVFEDQAVGLCATAYRRVDTAGNTLRDGHPPTTHAALAAALAGGNRLCHSSVMFRALLVRQVGGYTPSWFPVEDYDLWLRLLDVGVYRGIDEVLVLYTDNPEGVSQSRPTQQLAMAGRRRDDYLRSIDQRLSDPVGSPREAQRLRRQLARVLRQRSIAVDGLDHACYQLAMGSSAPAWRRRLRALTALSLLARGRR